ncbi:glyoxylase-like metal-dependent hydrolase (beta-lactamase superfamily II) [Bacillus sp. SORGH_AS 510]|uniref:MBL fold metallo-hydrolase n=1 Tax=Bacillus sp. SORGH_AS_0510 TaxID=3041771 RepID=UPI002784853C|nr:glyoxylase-like metal-dependent hydrolase (beta-lactamase superfamily II) [Bacillus sp. SORGH_AS_0510]
METEKDNKFEESFLPMSSIGNGVGIAVLPDVFCYTDQIVNLILVGNPNETHEFVLIDTGMPKSAGEIKDLIHERFGDNASPKAIILTHGHFDHVGSIAELLEDWKVPAYAHQEELPYLTGKKDYPKGDPNVDSGLVAKLSPMFPNHGIDISTYIQALPSDGSVPFMPNWQWIHTPGHTPGHVSFFREQDRTLIAGDAFVTVKQESLFKVMTQTKEISGPPKYYTTDWNAAYESVRKLEALKPQVAITGHGLPMSGKELEENLHYLLEHFNEIGRPESGRYVN